MSGRTITLKYAGKCAECGSALPAGSRARYYGRRRIYGTTCHQTRRVVRAGRGSDAFEYYEYNEPTGQTLSRLDPFNAYGADGQKIGRLCRCEDYPCCGH